LKIFHTDQFVLPLPPGHRFPMAKYARLRERVEAAGLVPPHALLSPDAATDEELLRVHDASWLDAVVDGTLSRAQTRRIGFPWSPGMVERSRRSVGATIAAAFAALDDGAAVNLAGGTHHAFPDFGQGFCVFNDVAVAVRALQARRRVRRIAILDTDVHQGDGTAAIFQREPEVRTISIHGATNFPFNKERSALDIALPDGAGDDVWSEAVRKGLDAAFAGGAPDVLFHVAGADAFEGDRLGRLAVSTSALAERDDLIANACAHAGVPLVVVMAGGYAARIEDTVDIHLHSVISAVSLDRRGAPEPTSL
jgi:acetoin utilization deacetylase AcuC-like enzyme